MLPYDSPFLLSQPLWNQDFYKQFSLPFCPQVKRRAKNWLSLLFFFIFSRQNASVLHPIVFILFLILLIIFIILGLDLLLEVRFCKRIVACMTGTLVRQAAHRSFTRSECYNEWRLKGHAIRSWSWEFLHLGIASPPKLPPVDLRGYLCIWNDHRRERQGVNAMLQKLEFIFLPQGISWTSRWVYLASSYCSRRLGVLWGSTAMSGGSWGGLGYSSAPHLLTGTRDLVVGDSIPSWVARFCSRVTKSLPIRRNLDEVTAS